MIRSGTTATTALVALLLIWSVGSPARADQQPRRPNVLLIAVDDLRPELGCYGADHVRSPNIDRLAGQGVVFRRAYVQQAVCGPSRASLLSGLRPDSSGVITNSQMLRQQRPQIVSLPHHFKQHGYHTISLGKIYHHPEDDPLGWSEPVWRPFGISWGWRNYRSQENRALIKKLHVEINRTRKTPLPLGRVKGPAYESMDLPDNVYPDGLTAEMAVHCLERIKDSRQPFFLAVGFYKPHLPFACPTKYWDLYDPAEIELPFHDRSPSGMPALATADSIELRQYHGIAERGRLTDSLARKLIHGYRACVSYTDAQIGRLLTQLDDLGLAENTIVVLWGDHGWHLRELGMWGKQTNFEWATRAPLIVRSPAMQAGGRTTDALVEMVDIYPTLCQLAGLPLPAHLEGTSFAPLLDEGDRVWKTAAFSQYPRGRPPKSMGYTIRTDRYRFTKWVDIDRPDKVVATELYDHRSDPDETINVAADRANAAVVKQLSQRLQEGWPAALPPR